MANKNKLFMPRANLTKTCLNLIRHIQHRQLKTRNFERNNFMMKSRPKFSND